jgi:hypothetical protein
LGSVAGSSEMLELERAKETLITYVQVPWVAACAELLA